MIDPLRETPIPVGRVPGVLQPMLGIRLHGSTIYRWFGDGLENFRAGGRYTSLEAPVRYIDRKSGVAAQSATPTPPRTVAQRKRASEEAAKQLDRLGA